MSDRDVWWDVFPGLELDPLADALTLALDRYGLPWLDAHASEDAIVAVLRDDARISQELPHHLYWYAELMEKLGDEELKQKAEAERIRLERKYELEEEAPLGDLGVDPA
jgi:hypothetical protein